MFQHAEETNEKPGVGPLVVCTPKRCVLPLPYTNPYISVSTLLLVRKKFKATPKNPSHSESARFAPCGRIRMLCTRWSQQLHPCTSCGGLKYDQESTVYQDPPVGVSIYSPLAVIRGVH